MSLNVLVIPEDFRKDQYVLAPIDQATRWDRIAEVIDMYPMVKVFLLIVDRDGKPGRRNVLTKIENQASERFPADRTLLAENAWQEIEVWALAGQDDLPKSWKWQAIRDEEHPKEKYFDEIAESRGLLDEPGEGRTTLGREAASNYAKVRARCNEIAKLEGRLEEWLE